MKNELTVQSIFSRPLGWIIGALALMTATAISFAPTALRAQGDPQAALQKMHQVMAKYQDGRYTLTLRSRAQGRLQPPEVVEVKNNRNGAFYLKWTGERFRDRELLYQPNWNGGKAWIKEGGALSFSAASVGLNDAVIKQDYRRSVDVLSLPKLTAEIEAWSADSAASIESNGDGVTITHPKNGRLSVNFLGNGLPRKIVFTDASGAELEIFEFANVQTNVGLTAADFDPANRAYSFPGYSSDGIFIDADRLKDSLNANWSRIKDYTCELAKREKIKGKMQEKQTIFLKFRKPCDLYLTWIKNPNKGRELIYRQGVDEKVIVHEGGVILGLASVRLALDSSLLMAETNHSLTHLDIGYTIKTIYDNLFRGLKSGEVKLKFKGVEFTDGRRLYLVESWFAKNSAKGYYAPHTLMGHDSQTGLPLKISNYAADDQLFEEFYWGKVRFNAGLTDKDFDYKNPQYKF